MPSHKLKILYAASNTFDGKIALSRFLQAMNGKPYLIKIAAYKKSSPQELNIDWTLDCLLDILRPHNLSMDNDNLRIYFEQVKCFNPDLIISDLEHFTSYIANLLNIPVWQCSSSLIDYAVKFHEKFNLKIIRQYSSIKYVLSSVQQAMRLNTVENSNYKYVYSHLGDSFYPPELKDGFEWIRPYHKIGRKSAVCHHNIIAALPSNNKKTISWLKQYTDVVVFSDFFRENYNNIIMKDLSNQEEYYCNLYNSNLFICEGQACFLADAFYNKKYCLTWNNFHDTSISNAAFSEQSKLSSSVYNLNEDISKYLDNSIKNRYDPQIKYLHEKIEEL